MELKSILKRIDERRKILGLSDAKASRKSKHNDVIKNIRKTVKDGHGSVPKIPTLVDLARALECDPAWLLGPESAPGTLHAGARSDLDMLVEQRDWYRREADALDRAISLLQRKDRAS